MPDFMRIYGDIRASQNEGVPVALVLLVAAATLLFVVYAVGALIQSILRRYKRSQER